MIDFEMIRMPAVAVFSTALFLEAFLTAKLFFEKHNLPFSEAMKWWAVIALATTSSVNAYAAIEVYNKVRLDSAVLTKLAFCLAGLNLLAWVYVFHRDKWRKR